jgi:mono/diheme cytochrome c family protein
MYFSSTSWVLSLGLSAVLALLSSAAQASSPIEQQAQWGIAARATDPGYAPSASRGKALYDRAFGRSAEMPNCAACHTANPNQQGKHAVTGKSIAPMAPSANPERFTDAAKTEKWFKRNCNDVIGRECTATEKSDFVEFLMKGVK